MVNAILDILLMPFGLSPLLGLGLWCLTPLSTICMFNLLTMSGPD
jgi:hypothetical protein